MRKIITIILIMSTCAMGIFAGGSQEVTTTTDQSAGAGVSSSSSSSKALGENVIEAYTADAPSSVVTTGMNSIANAFDAATGTFAMALTPFPNILIDFYTTNAEGNEIPSNIKLSNALLIGKDYYDDSTENVQITFNNNTFTGTTNSAQKSSWNMITVLFLTFFAAEIIFSTIYGYLTDRESGILKDIITKAIICLLLFVLVSALPFLIEAFRLGFFTMAKTITGIEEKTAPAGSARAALLDRMVNASVFEYPGLLIRNLAYAIDALDPTNVGGINLYDYVAMPGWDVTTGVLVKLFYLGLRVIACVLIIFSAFHVMLNVCEVYLLLGITACVTPFVVFSPLKFLGEKAVMSLFSNMMELFVILIVIFATHCTADAITSNLLSSIEIVYTDATFRFTGITQDNYKTLTGDDWPDAAGDDIPDEGVSVAINLAKMETNASQSNGFVNSNPSTNTYGAASSLYNTAALKVVADGIKDWIDDQWDETKKTLTGTISDPVSLEVWKRNMATSNKTSAQITSEFDKLTLENLPVADKMEFMNFLAMTMSPTGIGLEMVSASAKNNTGDFDVMLIHIITSMLCIFMQTYYVNQSSQITNAILSGNVSSEGLTSAMGKWAAAKTGGAMFRRAKSAGKAGVYGAGTAAGLGVGKMADVAKSNMESSGRAGTTGHKIVSAASNIAHKASSAAGEGAVDNLKDAVSGRPGESAQKRMMKNQKDSE